MAQMKAGQAVQRKEDHLYDTGGPQMGQDRRADAQQPSQEQIHHLRKSVAKTNVYLRSITAALRAYGHYHPAIAAGANTLHQFTQGLARHANSAAPLLKGFGVFTSVVIGVDRILEAQNGEELASACLDTATHLAMGLTPITAVLDGILTAVIGPSWPTKLAQFLSGISFEAYFKAWDDHRKGTGEPLIPPGPRKM
jgi:hypothetical protein